jgi:hypothetical protein
LFGIVIVFFVSNADVLAQTTKNLFPVYDSNGAAIDFAHVIVKADGKTYAVKYDTSGNDYKSLSQINPHWIKSIDILKENQLQGGTKTVLIMTLKRRRLSKLPTDLKSRFR